MKQFFRKKQMVPGVYSIAGEAVMRYLIIGEHHALLFDTGYGFGDLSGFVKGLTDLPLYVVNSHGHIDHAGANFQFKAPCYMHPADMEVYQHHQTQSFRKAGWQTLDKIQRIFFFWRLLIPKGYTQAQYLANPVSDNFLPVHEGDVFDLGGVTLLVVEIPGHTPGSIGLLCPEKKLFFSGDGMNGGVWMFLPESTKLSVYCASIQKVQKLDFDYLMAVAAKAVVESCFGRQPAHAYFTGSSTGGQQALSAAQRYPEDYDGILAIAPAFDRVNLHLAFLHDWLAVNKGKAGLFSQEDADTLTRMFLTECGEQGGRQGDDPFFYHPHAIKVTEQLLEKAGLTPAQSQGLMALFQQVTDPVTGHPLYEATMVPGSEACDMGLAYRCAQSFEQDMFYLFRWVLGADFDFRTFDFHTDAQTVHAALDEHLNATATDLSAFRARGGKLLLLHGTADPIIPYTSSVRYYEQVCQTMGDVSGFFRLFLIPGMAHTSGGPGLQDVGVGLPATPKDSKHLALLALKDWVETGCAPSTLYPVAFRDNNFANGFLPDGVEYEHAVACYDGAE